MGAEVTFAFVAASLFTIMQRPSDPRPSTAHLISDLALRETVLTSSPNRRRDSLIEVQCGVAGTPILRSVRNGGMGEFFPHRPTRQNVNKPRPPCTKLLRR